VDHFGTDHHEVDIGLSSMDLLTEHGITPDREIVLYCNTARRISHTYVVLKSLGYENVAFYEGSLTEWLANDGEVESGPVSTADDN
jgi:thiosulfate/3-mercaptopyruvate sulfurtransferase